MTTLLPHAPESRTQVQQSPTRSTTTAPHPRLSPAALGWSVTGVLFGLYALLSVRRHQLLRTSGFDLGIFEQSVRSWASGNWPTSRLKGPDFPLLGDHFSPIVAVLGPIYRVFPSAVTLLVAQAALFAIAAYPLVRLAAERFDSRTALVIGFGYGLSFGVAQAVAFDFHEIAFAAPLLAFAGVAFIRHRPVSAVVWVLPLLLVKEDLGLTVMVLAILVAVRFPTHRRLGILVAAGSAIWTASVMGVVIPAINPDDTNGYLHQFDGGIPGLAGFDTKLTTLVLLLACTAFGAVRSPVVWLMLPTLGWRFLSDNSAYWGTSFHYSAVLMPVLFAALLDAMYRGRFCPGTRRWLLGATSAVAIVSAVSGPLATLVTPEFYRTPVAVAEAHSLLEQIPDGATVSASNWLVPQLTGRAEVSLFGKEGVPTTEFVVVELSNMRFPLSAEQTERLLTRTYAAGYVQIAATEHAVLLQRSR